MTDNVFEMLVANGGPDFWVRRITWGGTCARVIGAGEFTRLGPYYGNPSVLMDVYTVDGVLHDGLAQLPVPGTFKSWRRIDPPEWSGSVYLRPLDDPEIGAALAALDKKRHKGPGGAANTSRIDLSVPFERKDEAKRLGAKWDRGRRLWYMLETNTNGLEKARAKGFLTSE